MTERDLAAESDGRASPIFGLGILVLGAGVVLLFASFDNATRISPPTIEPWVGLATMGCGAVTLVAASRLQRMLAWSRLLAGGAVVADAVVLVLAGAPPLLVSILGVFALFAVVRAGRS